MGGVFINYRQKDASSLAAAIHKDLTGHFGPEQVFRDCDSLQPGDDYPDRIRDQVRASEILLNTLTDALANSLAMLNAPMNEDTETRADKERSSIFPPEAAVLLREMWRLRNKHRP